MHSLLAPPGDRTRDLSIPSRTLYQHTTASIPCRRMTQYRPTYIWYAFSTFSGLRPCTEKGKKQQLSKCVLTIKPSFHFIILRHMITVTELGCWEGIKASAANPSMHRDTWRGGRRVMQTTYLQVSESVRQLGLSEHKFHRSICCYLLVSSRLNAVYSTWRFRGCS